MAVRPPSTRFSPTGTVLVSAPPANPLNTVFMAVTVTCPAVPTPWSRLLASRSKIRVRDAARPLWRKSLRSEVRWTTYFGEYKREYLKLFARHSSRPFAAFHHKYGDAQSRHGLEHCRSVSSQAPPMDPCAGYGKNGPGQRRGLVRHHGPSAATLHPALRYYDGNVHAGTGRREGTSHCAGS